MKKYINNKINVVILVLFLIGVTSYFYKSQIGSLIWTIKYKNKSPVEWNNISIKFPKGLTYKVDNGVIAFMNWEHQDEFLLFRKKDLANTSKAYVVNFFVNKQFQILDDKETYFKGFNSIFISYLDSNTGTYNEVIFVIPQNMIIHYEGKRDKNNEFIQVIEDIDFINKHEDPRK